MNAGKATVNSETAAYAFRAADFDGSDSEKCTCLSVEVSGVAPVEVQCGGDPGHHNDEEWLEVGSGKAVNFEVDGLGVGRIGYLRYRLPAGGSNSEIKWSVTKVRG